MEFKISEKSKITWQNLMEDMDVESQMSEDALNRKKMKDAAEKIKKKMLNIKSILKNIISRQHKK